MQSDEHFWVFAYIRAARYMQTESALLKLAACCW